MLLRYPFTGVTDSSVKASEFFPLGASAAKEWEADFRQVADLRLGKTGEVRL